MKTHYKIINLNTRPVEMKWMDYTMFHKLNLQIIRDGYEVSRETWFCLQIEECKHIGFAKPSNSDSLLCEILHNDRKVINEVLLKICENLKVEFDIVSEINYTEVE